MTSFALLIPLLLTGADAYEWPLELPRSLTSSFGEYRPGRFHAGIDLRTGPPGKAVHAPDDGSVVRVRCSPWGYGKAVYLKLRDGNTVVFGHLSAFEEPLAEYVRRQQHARKSYTVDLYPDEGTFPVSRGAVVARSGQTGIGVPHLHYELRDELGRPVNPRLVDVSWPDSNRPTPRKVVVVPNGPGSTVNGGIVPVVLPLKTLGDGAYATEPVSASGAVGFGVDAIDPANGGQTKLGVYEVCTSAADGQIFIFRMRNDLLSYETIHHGAVAYHPFLKGSGRFLLQYRWPGNVAPAYGVCDGDGWYQVPLDPSDVRIDIEDFRGNSVSVFVPIRFDMDADRPAPAVEELGKGRVILEGMADWVCVTMHFTKPEPETPVFAWDGPDPLEGGSVRRVGPRTFRAGYRPRPGARAVTLRVDHPRIDPWSRRVDVFTRGEPERAAGIDGALVAVRRESPYGAMLLWAEPGAGTPPPCGNLIGDPHGIGPKETPVDEPVGIALPLPDGVTKPERLHIYRAGSRSWSRLPTERTARGFTTTTRSLGVFAVIEDVSPPEVKAVRLGKGGRVTSRRPSISATVSDKGSGIDLIDVYCGDQWLLMEYDPERSRIDWARDEDLPAGKQDIVFRVVDAAGNQTEVVKHIVVPAPEGAGS
ncbi:MAG: hypothetical protein GY851_05300 [bacterium]|nr:hypothetical protein [bacterium]